MPKPDFEDPKVGKSEMSSRVSKPSKPAPSKPLPSNRECVPLVTAPLVTGLVTGPLLIVVVTGLAGAGKSTALSSFDDLGYHTIDNLPLLLLNDLLAFTEDAKRLAIGIDSRSLAFSPQSFVEAMSSLRQNRAIKLHVLLMDGSDESLIRRFSETRRRHPLTRPYPDEDAEQSQIDSASLAAAIAKERGMMQDVRQVVDGIIDTSNRTTTDTRRLIRQRYGWQTLNRLRLTLVSFGFASGVPREADMVYDVRFLRNPYYEESLRPLTGLDHDVSNYVRADEAFKPFTDMLKQQIDFLIPRFEAEGKTYLTIAFGCTGGRHRSVTMVEYLARYFHSKGFHPALDHRNAPKPGLRQEGIYE